MFVAVLLDVGCDEPLKYCDGRPGGQNIFSAGGFGIAAATPMLELIFALADDEPCGGV